MEKLSKISEIEIIHFTQKDVVRHPLAAKVVNAYEEQDGELGEHRGSGSTEEKERDNWL
jgi:phosphate starvation-inducible protein PhoH